MDACAVTVVVIEDHPVFREGLVAALADTVDLHAVAAVGTLAEAYQTLEEHQPDVALVDLLLPDGSGLEIVAWLRARRMRTAALVLTMNDDTEAVLEAVRAGAHGYLLKGAGRVDIAEAVRAMARGRVVLDRAAGELVLATTRAANPDPARLLGITEREADVLRLLASGLTNQAIAQRLGVAPKTVRNQVSVVLRKLAVDNREQAARKAIDAGLR